MRHFVFACLTYLATSLSAAAAPGDPWEGTWRNADHKTLWLYQNGNTVWGSATHGYRYHAQVSPDGRTLRGTYYQKNHKQGLFEFTLSDDGQMYLGGTVSANAADTIMPASSDQTTDGERVTVDFIRTDYIADGFADGTQGFDSALNMNNPTHVAWINYQGLFVQPDGTPLDISDLTEPAPGDLGLWDVTRLRRPVGVVAMNRTEDGGFSATGPVRLHYFENGAPIEITFMDRAGTDTDRVMLAGTSTVSDTVVITAKEGDGYLVTFSDGLFPVDDFALWLQLRPGTVPARDPAPEVPPVDLSQLDIPAPGNLGLMRVTTPAHGEIGTVNWAQDPATLKVTMEGQIIIPEWLNGAPLDVTIIDGPDVLDDAISLSDAASGTRVTTTVTVRERDGDQYVVTLRGGELSAELAGDYKLYVNHIPGSRPALGTPPGDDLRTLRIDTARVPMGLAVQVYDAPARDAAVIGMLPNDATGLILQACAPEISDAQLALNGEDLYNVMADRFCLITAPDIGGWVGGAFLTR